MSTYPRRSKVEALVNAVDVVKRLHDPTDQVPNAWHLRVQHTFSLMTSLDLRSSRGAEGEFRQHDGVVTILMFSCCRASPKHRYDIIEVDYGGGGHRTRLRDPRDQLLCLWC